MQILQWQKRVSQVLENPATLSGKIFYWAIHFFIIIALVSFSISTLPDLDEGARQLLHYIDIVCFSFFVVEYLLRVFAARSPLKFFFSFFGIIDLIAISSFLVSFGLWDVRVLRSFRFLQLFKMAKYHKVFRRYYRACMLLKVDLSFFLAIALVIIYIAAVGIYHFEGPAQPEKFSSIFDSLWWAVVTLTTVGYGDVFPITVGGKVFTFFILLVGLGLVSVPAGLMASALGEAREMEKEDEREGRIDPP